MFRLEITKGNYINYEYTHTQTHTHIYIYIYIYTYMGRVSAVGIATHYGLEGPGIESR